VTDRPDGHTDRNGRDPAVTMTEMLFVGFFRLIDTGVVGGA
jgi:hypothetical protein